MTRVFLFGLLASAFGSAAASPIVVDANRQFVGFYQGVRNLEQAVSSKGYRFAFERFTGRHAPVANAEGVYFATADCSGQAYSVEIDGPIIAGTIYLSAFHWPATGETASLDDPPLFYVPQSVNPVRAPATLASQFAFAGTPAQLTCEVVTPFTVPWAYPIQPNDPDETAVPNARFQGPLRVISSWLFRNGFEPSTA